MPKSKPKMVDEEIQPEFISSTPKSKRKYLIIFLIVVAAGLLWKYKSLFVVAMVNGKPVTRAELNQTLASRYGSETLDQILTQKLIESEVAKQKISVSDEQVNSRLNEFTGTLPQNMTIDQALKMQGMTLDQLKSRLRLMVALDEMFKPKIQITDEEIDNFIKENKSFLTASTSAAQKDEATAALKNQKFNDEVSKWITDLKSSAKIQTFL